MRSLYSKKKYQNKNKNIRPTYSSRSNRKKRCCNYVNLIKVSLFQSPRPAQRFLIFNVLKKSQFFFVFVALCLSSKFLWCFIDVTYTTFTLLERSTYIGQKSGDAEAAKPALAFENVDFVDDVVIFVIVVRINETRKVLRKVCPRYYINK